MPYLIADLNAQNSGYTATQPCMDTLLYQIEHINETVIALPPAMSVKFLSDRFGEAAKDPACTLSCGVLQASLVVRLLLCWLHSRNMAS
jgi:hypothetical protein